MKLKTFLIPVIVIFVITSNIVTAFAVPRDWREISPQEAQSISSIDALGTNLNMTMKEIKDSLANQGYKVIAGKHGYSYKGINTVFDASYYHRGIDDDMPFDDNKKPISISYRLNGDKAENCVDMLRAIETFCTNGTDKFPCIKSGNFIRASIIPRKASSDGMLYKMDIKIDPKLQCMIRLKKTVIRSPASK